MQAGEAAGEVGRVILLGQVFKLTKGKWVLAAGMCFFFKQASKQLAGFEVVQADIIWQVSSEISATGGNIDYVHPCFQRHTFK